MERLIIISCVLYLKFCSLEIWQWDGNKKRGAIHMHPNKANAQMTHNITLWNVGRLSTKSPWFPSVSHSWSHSNDSRNKLFYYFPSETN
ncbi:hypothetical protein GGR55DRAFT_145779 [Xylaria sp. FL0064]|nr:hypothetical protein GGR55DRAFT_145779 [Xylaria sp. FL0064]